ncbi:MAG: hypothetical protein M3451_04985 [Chloroflexota bacterium]|nr:hypothetical protein [Chloroflexota bacterium]
MPPRYLDGRDHGPLFVTERRARLELPACDVDPDIGRARLSYRRADEYLAAVTARESGGPWNLHPL